MIRFVLLFALLFTMPAAAWSLPLAQSVATNPDEDAMATLEEAFATLAHVTSDRRIDNFMAAGHSYKRWQEQYGRLRNALKAIQLRHPTNNPILTACSRILTALSPLDTYAKSHNVEALRNNVKSAQKAFNDLQAALHP